jgi:hypothetical protein
MGADARAVIQYKVCKDRGEWWTPLYIDLPRYYEFFGLVAGVRGLGLKDEYPRGWPDGLWQLEDSDLENWFGHARVAPTWVNMDEYSEILIKIENDYCLNSPDVSEDDVIWPMEYDFIVLALARYKDEFDDARLVIAFDQG